MTFEVFGGVEELWNVCPKITKAEVLKKAGFRAEGMSEKQAFSVRIQWGGRQVRRLDPGERIQLARSAARQLAKAYRHAGVVLVQNHKSEKRLRLEGLMAAADHLYEMGEGLLSSGMVNLDQQSQDRLRGLVRGQLYNQAREVVLRQEIERVDQEPDAEYPSHEVEADRVKDRSYAPPKSKAYQAACGKEYDNHRRLMAHQIKCETPECREARSGQDAANVG